MLVQILHSNLPIVRLREKIPQKPFRLVRKPGIFKPGIVDHRVTLLLFDVRIIMAQRKYMVNNL